MKKPKPRRDPMPPVHGPRAIRVNVYYSPEARSYWADSPDLDGLAASGKSRQEVEQEALWAAETLFEINGTEGVPQLAFQDAELDPE
jgi:predicted RNase H-like HicB family nuclease